MTVRYFALFVGLICLACAGTQTSESQISYPQPTPDSTALRFLPGIVSTGMLDFNSAFSPDGKSYYFTRSTNGQWDIYVSGFDGSGWTEPVITGFCDSKYSEADPAFSPDGGLYFISNHHADTTRKDHDIWMTRLLEDGTWAKPENVVPINSDSDEYYVSFAANGNMYFASAKPGGYGDHDIYRSRYVDGKFAVPENLGPSINSERSDHDPAISKDETLMIFKSEDRPDGFGSADLYCSIVDDNNQWRQARHLGHSVNTNTYEYCGYWSPEGKYFFFSSEGDVKWIGTEALKKEVFSLFR